MSLESLERNVATLRVLDPSHLHFAQGKREQIAEIFQRVVGAPVAVEIGAPHAEEPKQPESPINEDVRNDPIVRKAQDLFGGSIVSVEDNSP